MAGIGDGILADGILAEGTQDITFYCGTPAALALAMQPASAVVYTNITIGVGTSAISISALPVSIILTGDVTIAANLIDQLVFTTYPVTVETASVVNISVLANTIRLSLRPLSVAYAGELVVVGLMAAEFSATRPDMAFSVTQPTATFTIH